MKWARELCETPKKTKTAGSWACHDVVAHRGIRWRRAWMKEGQTGGVSAGACASHRPMEHGSPAQTQHRPLLSVSLHMRNVLSQCMLSCTPKRAPHLPNTTMPSKSCTHLHLGSIAITLTLPPAYSPKLLHNCRGMNCAHAPFITLMMMMIAFIITLGEMM